MNFLQAQKYISDKEKNNTEEVTPTKKMSSDDPNIQRTGPNESKNIGRKSSDVSSRQHIVSEKFKRDQHILTSKYYFIYN